MGSVFAVFACSKVDATLAERFVRQLPVRLIGDNATSRTGWMLTWHAVAWN
jgi:hypothetical protein